MDNWQFARVVGLVLLYVWAVPTLLSADGVVPFFIGVIIGVLPIVEFLKEMYGEYWSK